jgi:hypothetical protein
MGASVSFESTQLAVIPGGEARLRLRVRNTGTVVDQFTFEGIGEAAPWMSFEPAQISLFPAMEDSVELVVRPPRDHTAASGPIPFAVRMVSQEDPEGSMVDEGTLHIESFDQRSIELMPRMSSGSRSARHEVAVDNHGNTTISPAFTAIDPDDLVDFEIKPTSLSIEPGLAGFAEVTVRPKQRFWRGEPRRLPFQLVAMEEGREPLAVDGVLLQKPILPRWFWKAVLAALLLLVLLFVLWRTVLRPSIESTARDSAEEAVAELAGDVEEINDRLDQAGIPPADPDGAPAPTPTTVPEPEPTVPPAPTTTVVDEIPPPSGQVSVLGDPIDFRLTAAVGAGGTATDTFVVPDAQVLSLTDFVLQNPTGSVGALRIRRNGNIVFESQMANFRDLDLHFVAPYQFDPGAQVVMELVCGTPGPGFTECSGAVSFAGFIASTAE